MAKATDMTAVVTALAEKDRFLVTSHEAPDGDALGSLLATELALRSLGKDALMFLGGEAPLPGEYRFLRLPELGLHRELPSDADERVLVALDCASASRVGAMPGLVERAPFTVNVDHHHDNPRFGDVNLVVPAGHTCALVGRTGSGKSTLASLLSRAVEPPRGTVLLGGTDVRDLDLQQLRAAVGVVTQRTEVLAGTLAENMTLFGDVPRASVEAAVAELGLTDWVAGLPDGLDTMLGPGGTTLSAGEEQLVAFARLLVREVRVVVLDEATARMDPVTEARVVRAADRLISGRTGILVAHRLSTTERAEQVAVLESGRIIQHGPRDRLAAAEGPFRRLLEAAAHERAVEEHHHEDAAIGSVRRSTTPPAEGGGMVTMS